MTEFKVLAIDDMIRAYPKLEEENVKVIIITRKNDYKYSFEPLLELGFDDVTKDDMLRISEESRDKFIFISQEHIDSVAEKIPEIKKADVVYVCCDAGLSRSPAVASALAHFLGEAKSYGYITYRYPYANKDVFQTLLSGLSASLSKSKFI